MKATSMSTGSDDSKEFFHPARSSRETAKEAIMPLAMFSVSTVTIEARGGLMCLDASGGTPVICLAHMIKDYYVAYDLPIANDDLEVYKPFRGEEISYLEI
jgi:hypothetical protein